MTARPTTFALGFLAGALAVLAALCAWLRWATDADWENE